ncbi:MAG: peptidase M3, partial [Muribaculaceae bacterium]|nr:peptidase M3 [Muribaculaceae bacterium]
MKKILYMAVSVAVGSSALGLSARENPFLKPYQTQYEIAPYSEIMIEDFIPAIKVGVAEQDANILKIVSNPEPADFNNTILALEDSSPILERVASVYYHYDGALSTPEFAALAEEAIPLLNDASNRVNLNPDLFARIKEAYDNRDALGMTPVQKRVTEKYYREFAERGAALPADKKAELSRINNELSKLFIQYNKNLLAATNDFYIHVGADAVSGLPES